MKFVIVKDSKDPKSSAHSWRLETEAGVAIAKSTRSHETREKCIKEITGIKEGAATTKIIDK